MYCLEIVLRLSNGCIKCAWNVSEEYQKIVWREFLNLFCLQLAAQEVTMLLSLCVCLSLFLAFKAYEARCFKGVSKVFQGYSKNVLREFKECPKGVLKML